MTTFKVVPAELSAASGLIRSAADELNGAESAAASAEAVAGAFGGEAAEGAFVSACGRALQAILALSTTMGTLAECVQAAADGYLITDQGVIPAKGVPGAVTPNNPAGGGPRPLSPTWSKP